LPIGGSGGAKAGAGSLKLSLTQTCPTERCGGSSSTPASPFPFSVMDLFLTLADNGIHDVLWTDELLDE
jgi:hypothetical protein